MKKLILIFNLLSLIFVYGQQKTKYPQDFTPQARKTLAQEMADSAKAVVLDSIAASEAQLRSDIKDTNDVNLGLNRIPFNSKSFAFGVANTTALAAVTDTNRVYVDGLGEFIYKSNGFTNDNGAILTATGVGSGTWVLKEFLQDTTTRKTKWYGSNTNTVIQSVWNLSEPGDKIILNSGTYSGLISITDSYSDSIEIIGAGIGQTILNGIQITQVKGVSIHDLTSIVASGSAIAFDGGTDSLFEYNARVYNVSVRSSDGSADHGIIFQKGGRFIIDNTETEGFTHGIAIRVRDGIVTNSIGRNNNLHDITIKTGSGVPDDGANRNIIVDNLLSYNCTSSSVSVNATNSDTLENIRISGVVAYKSGGVVSISTSDPVGGHGIAEKLIEVTDCYGYKLIGTAYYNAGSTVRWVNCNIDSSSQKGFQNQDLTTPTRTAISTLVNCTATNCATGNVYGSNFGYSKILNFNGENIHDRRHYSATAATKDTINNYRWPVWSFDDSQDEFVGIEFIPQDFDLLRSNFYVDLYWISRTAISGAVNWGVNYNVTGEGDDIDVPDAGGTQYSSATTAGTVDFINITTIARGSSAFKEDGIISVLIFRDGDGSSGTDDLIGDALLLFARVRY